MGRSLNTPPSMSDAHSASLVSSTPHTNGGSCSFVRGSRVQWTLAAGVRLGLGRPHGRMGRYGVAAAH